MRTLSQHIISCALAFILLNSFCYAQKGTVAGRIYGIDGPLQGATVAVGTVTVVAGMQGEFSIGLNEGSYLLYITYSGYSKLVTKVRVLAGNTVFLNFTMQPDKKMKDVVVTGSRSLIQRSNLSSAVPVDVIYSNQFLQTSQPSLTQMLQYAIPSFNASRQVVNEPITLRGLDPDQVLILVNGKRYHNMSFVNWGGVKGILGRGAVSNDLNSIPYSAIEKIEVLRDGASAQYGSDAIAGVINIHLKNSTNKTWAQLQTGQFYKGDGWNSIAGINHGLALAKKGFLNFSGAYRFQKPTFRGGTYKGTVYTTSVTTDDSIIRARNFNRNDISNAGISEQTSFGFSMNGGYSLNETTELSWTTVLNNRNTIFSSGYTFPKNASRINPELFPDGFKARPSNHTIDVTGIAGIKGQTKNQWHWELSTAYGSNKGKYYNNKTNNPSQYFSLGKNAPTSFYTGSLLYGQVTNNFQLTKNFLAGNKAMNLGIGTEWRHENFEMKRGEEASWKNYDSSGRKQGGSGGLVIDGKDAIKAKRDVAAVYADIESEWPNHVLTDAALRYEYYGDFGSNLAGKLAVRYKLNDKFSIRSSVSNGFRAPSLQQRYYNQTRTNVLITGGVYRLVSVGIFRNESEIAKALGIPFLGAETSFNVSTGITGSLYPNIRLTADVYWIEIRDRIVLSGVFDRSINQNLDSLLSNLTDVVQVQFFANAIHTRTKGLDIILNGNWKIKQNNLLVMLGANLTQTHLIKEVKRAGKLRDDSLNTNTLFGREERGKLEKGQPADKIILSLQYEAKKLGLHLRNTRFGRTVILSNDPSLNADESFSPKIITDFSISYSLKPWFTVSGGANNIFSVYPDRLKDYRNTGEGIYVYGQEATPFGFNGGYYFITLNINIEKQK